MSKLKRIILGTTLAGISGLVTYKAVKTQKAQKLKFPTKWVVKSISYTETGRSLFKEVTLQNIKYPNIIRTIDLDYIGFPVNVNDILREDEFGFILKTSPCDMKGFLYLSTLPDGDYKVVGKGEFDDKYYLYVVSSQETLKVEVSCKMYYNTIINSYVRLKNSKLSPTLEKIPYDDLDDGRYIITEIYDDYYEVIPSANNFDREIVESFYVTEIPDDVEANIGDILCKKGVEKGEEINSDNDFSINSPSN